MQTSRPIVNKDEWTVSVWSDSPQDAAAVRSMLSLFGKLTAARWSFSDLPNADLLLVGSASAFLPLSQELDGPQVVAQLLEPGEAHFGSDDALSINRPLRAMSFIELLDEAARRLHVLRTRAALEQEQEVVALDQFQPLLAAGEALHALRLGGSATPIALMGTDGSRLAMINVRNATLTSAHAMRELLEHLGRQFQKVELRTESKWAVSLQQSPPQSLDALCWQLGGNLAHHFGLAPWLQNDESYRLVNWPDFGTIGNDRVGFKLSAKLTRQPLTPHQLCAATSLGFNEVASFLNSVSLCGLLVAGPATQPRNSPARAHAPERRSMIARLRSRLGLGLGL